MRPVLRHSLRRYIHSFTPSVPPRRVQYSSKFTIGLSFVAAAYVGWQIAGNDRRIALDTPPRPISQKADAAPDTPPPKTNEPARSEPPIPVERERVEPPENTDSENTPGTEEGEGAFNPVTGEINWDCPCLGGMAHGPCGQQFREAFSCFVYSEKEPKGIDCVDKFKNMQDCFREHPDIYGEEIADDEDAPESSSSEKDTPSQPQPITHSQETALQERAAN